MAKKLVKYAFGTPEKYESMLKRDDYTVYFVYNTIIDANGKEVPGPYGTIYKGNTRIGSACASDIVFDKKLVITVLQGETAEDSVFYTIEPGTSLTQFVEGLIKQTAAWDEKLYSDFVGDGTAANPGIIYATIAQESAFDANGDALGVVAEAINTRIADSISADGVITSYLEENYVSNDKLGRIEELAEILDEETVEVLINAAAGIQEVLDAYYTKEEAEELLQDVITADTSAGFPAVGNSKKLYVSADDNYMYRWGKYDPSEEQEYYVMVSGGGGGGGSADVKIETHVYIKDAATSVSIAKDTDFTAYYAFSSANTYTTYHPVKGFQVIQQQISNIGTVKYYLDGIQIGSGQCAQANYYQEDDSKNKYNTYTIPRAKFTGTRHTLKIVASDVNGNTAEESITINIVNVVITSSFAANPSSLEKDLTVPVTVASSGAVDVYYQVDNEEPQFGLTVKSGSGTNPLTIPCVVNGVKRTHGTHTIQVWAKTFIAESGTEIVTSPLTWEVIWFDPENPLPIVSFVCTDEKQPDGTYAATQYEYSSFTYQVYPSSDIQLISLKDGVETVIKDLVDMDTNSHKWSYIFDEPGVYDLYAKIKYLDEADRVQYLESDRFTITVAASPYTMDPVAGAMFYMNARNHDNNSSHEWISEIHTDEKGEVKDPIKAILNNFAWNQNSGWYVDGATTSLRVGGGATCEIPFAPFEKNFARTGMTFEIDFSTSNLSNSETEVIKCYSEREKRGIVVTATGAYWETGDWAKTESNDNRIQVPFKEEQRIRLSFVLTPNNADDEGNGTRMADIWNESAKKYETVDTVAQGWWRFLKVYINGICVSIDSYTEDGKISQSSDLSTILIGSNEATVDIYSIRMYPKVLYDKEIIDNYIADTQDPVEKLSIFKRNNVLNDAGTAVDNIKLSTMLPCMYVTCQTTSSYEGFTNEGNILPINKADKRGYIVIYNCDNLSDEYKEKFLWAKSFIAYNAQMCVQGTSSQYYPRKNYKLTFKPQDEAPKTEEKYKKNIASKKPTLLYVGTTGTGYDDTNLNDWVMNSVLTEDMYSKYSTKYKLRDFDESVEKTDIEHISSIPATKYCVKADFMESSSTHNTGLAKYADYVLKSIGEEYLTPPQLAQFRASKKSGVERMNDVDIRTTIDGYPTAIFWRKTVEDEYTFLGKYNFNHDKGAEEVFGFIDGISELVNPYTGKKFSEFNEDYVDDAPKADRKEYISPVECWEFTNNTTNLCKFKYLTNTSFTETTVNDKGKTVPAWIESFEARHPDNDTLIDDMEGGDWIPSHWAEFCSWVSSTDTMGYHDPVEKTLQIPHKWEGTVDELLAGAAEVEAFVTIKATFDILNENPLAYAQKDDNGEYIKGILEPEKEVDGEMIGDNSYLYYGYVVTFNEHEGLWVLGEKYEAKETAVDIKKAYYIAIETDKDYGKVYRNINGVWTQFATLADYKLVTPATYESVVYRYDTADYRLTKFYNELKDHMRVKFVLAYYILSEFFSCIDQRAKNMMFATWGYEPESVDEVKNANAYTTVEAAARNGYKPVYEYDLKEVEKEGFYLTKGYVVRDEESYNLLPETYRAKYGEWGTTGLEESLPWLAVEFDATPAKDLVIKVNGPEDFETTISYPDVDKEVTLLTLNAEELGTELVNGTWTVTVNDYALELEVADEATEVVEGGKLKETVSVKTVLYYVPNKYFYKYYPIFYDNDSVLGLNNTGYLIYKPNVESTDTVGSGYAFNGADSVLWLNIKDAFYKEIADIYSNMRKLGLTYEKAMDYFTRTQSDAWSESIYNMDAKFKYVEPATIGYIDFSKQDDQGVQGVNVQDSYYLFECQGSRATHRSWWLNNRFNYMDSRYDTGEYHDSYALFRLYTNLTEGTYNKVVEPDPTFYITPYSDMYLRIKFGSRYGVVRANKNTTYMVNSGTDDKYNDTETMVYGAPNILSYGDLTAKYIKLCNVGPSSRITDLILGHDAPYFNDNLTNLSFNQSNVALKKVDVRNCRFLNTLNNLNSLRGLEEFLATNTALSSFDFSTEGVNIKKIEYPASLGSLKLFNMPYIANSGLKFDGFKNLQSIWIERCPKMDSWAIISGVLGTANNILSNVRVTDVDWYIGTATEFELWNKFLGLKGLDSYGATNAHSAPYITGIVTIGDGRTISRGYREGVKKFIKDATDGAVVTILGGNEVDLTGISIKGPEKLTPGVVYKFEVAYSPDRYVLDSEKGVEWNIPAGLVVHNTTDEYAEISFEGSASGTESYTITATSTVNPAFTARCNVRPQATLEYIKLFSTEGVQYTSEGITIYEGDTVNISVRFTPEDTKDKDIKITLTNPENFVKIGSAQLPYEYSDRTNTLSLTGADVSTTRTSVLTITSVKVPSVSVSIPVHVKNIVSRIVYLQNETRGLHEKLQGYVNVYVDDDATNTAHRVFSDENGVVIMPTNEYDPANGKFGLKKISCEAHANREAELGLNRPKKIEFAQLPEGVAADIEATAEFYEPITCVITVENGGQPVDDAWLMISSVENASAYGDALANPPYNNVHVEPAERNDAGVITKPAKNPVEIKLLANTTHSINIVQTDPHSTATALTKVYSDFNGTITTGTGTSVQNIKINVSRDYLGDITEAVDATELRMRVVTGDDTYAKYRTVRIYYKTVGPIVVNWGDRDEGNSEWYTALPSTNGEERIVYHTYKSNSKEYTISVGGESVEGNASSTQYIKWFHVMRYDADTMSQCMGTGNTDEGFKSDWKKEQGGLVAYQSCGAAEFAKAPSFKFGDTSKSRLLCVGNIYKGIKDMTSAEGLFMNSTLEQIPEKPLFANNPNITTFKQCFAKTNITVLPANFFANNKKAKNFEGLCSGCTKLTSINTAENIQFIFTDDVTEVENVNNMFLDCAALVSEVPALWKEFYGCSFLEGKTPNSFKGCPNIINLNSVPESWGGNGPEYTYTASVIPLRYVQLECTGDKFGTFELSNITLKGNYKYVLDISFVTPGGGDPYGVVPIFGGARATNPLDLNSIDSTIDLAWGGTGDYKTQPTGFTGYVGFRANNEENIAAMHEDLNNASYTRALKFNKKDPIILPSKGVDENGVAWARDGIRLRFDICYSKEGSIMITQPNNERISPIEGFVDHVWSADADWVSNVPPRIFGVYALPTMYRVPQAPDTIGNYTAYEPGGKYRFHELKIYDRSGNLVHDIVPVYAVVGGTAMPVLTDSLATENNIYRFSGQAGKEAPSLTYYRS